MVKSTRVMLNTWRERGFDDGYAGRVARTPLNVEEDCRKQYLAGYSFGRRERERKDG